MTFGKVCWLGDTERKVGKMLLVLLPTFVVPVPVVPKLLAGTLTGWATCVWAAATFWPWLNARAPQPPIIPANDATIIATFHPVPVDLGDAVLGLG